MNFGPLDTKLPFQDSWKFGVGMIVLLVIFSQVIVGMAAGAAVTDAENPSSLSHTNHISEGDTPIITAQSTSKLTQFSPGDVATKVAENESETREKVTLLTGQTVTVVHSGNQTEYLVDASVPMNQVTGPEGTYIYPEGMNFARFDRDLFNVDLLLRQNLSDGESGELPLIITESPDSRAGGSLLETNANSNRPGVSNSFTSALSSAKGLETSHVLGSIGGASVTLDKGKQAAAYQELRQSENIESVYLDKRVHVLLDDAESVVNADVSRSQYNVSGAGVTVAVLDTGVDDTHPDLDDSVTLEKDFTGEGTVEDSHGHGTHVAGIISGDGTASNGTYVGIAPNSSVMNLRVLDSDGYGSSSDIIDAIEFADQKGADIVSMSLGGDTSSNDPFFDAVNTAVDNGTTVIVAAGNDGDNYETVKSPGVVPSAITVGASDDADDIAWFSSRGPTPLRHYVKPDLVAPGVSIVSAKAGTEDYTSKSGTSMATPVVSGAAALVVEHYGDVSPTEVKSLLVTTTDRPGNYDVYTAGSGRLNTTASLGADLIIDEPTIDFQTISAQQKQSRSFRITNIGDSTRTLDLTTAATSLDGASGNVSLNRSTVTVDPGESVGVGLIVTADTTMGTYSGHVQVENGAYTANFGYLIDAPYTLTVDKSAVHDSDVGGDPVFLHDHDRDGASSSTSISATTSDGSQGQATLDVLEGNYTLYSAGTDETTGEIVLMARHLTITSDTTVNFDESNTAVYSLDTSDLESTYGDLDTLRVHARIGTVDGTHTYFQMWRTFHETQTVRFSEGDFNATVTHLLAPASEYPNNEKHLDTPVAFDLFHQRQGVQGNETFEVKAEELAQHNVTYYRNQEGQRYNVTRSVDNSILYRPIEMGEWAVRDRTTQTLFTSPDESATSPVYFIETTATDNDWTYHPGAGVAAGVGESTPVEINKQPLTGKATVDVGHYTNRNNVSLKVTPQVAQGLTRDILETSDATTDYTVKRDGSIVEEGSVSTRNVSYLSDASVPEGTTYELITLADNGDRSLSTKTRTAVQATYTGDGDTTPPAVINISPANLSSVNSLPTGFVDLNLTIDDDTLGNETVLVRYADASVTSTPYTASIPDTSSDWNEATVESRDGSGEYQATINTDLGTETIHLEVAVIDDAGNAISTTAYDAYAVDNRTGSDATVTGSFLLADGTAATSDTVTFTNSGTVAGQDLTDSNGDFEVTVGDGATYEVTYRQDDVSSDTDVAFPTDGSPDIYAVGTVDITGSTDLGSKSLPEGHRLNVSVVNESGSPVSNATVDIRHYNETVSASVTDTTNSDGAFEPTGSDGSGLEVTGNVSVKVNPPEGEGFVNTTYSDSTTVTGTTELEFVLDEKSGPTAEFTTNVSQVGIEDTIKFNGSNSTDDTGISSYQWDFGDGSTGSGEILTHSYEAPGTYTVTLTVTDEDGLQDTAQTSVTVEDETPPNASLSTNRSSVEVGIENLELDASGSTDNYDITEYRWDLTGDGVDDVTTTDPTAVTSFDTLGEVSLEVTVVDGNGNTDSATVTVTVEDTTSPTAAFDANATSVAVGTAVKFDANASSDNHQIASYDWAFDDGTTATGEAVTHSYSSPGTYEVALTVTDESGNEDTATTTVEVVDDSPPEARLSANRTTAEVGIESVELNASESTDNNEITEYRWDISGDGTVDETTVTPTLATRFETLGDHQITVTVVDSDGNTDSASVTINVEDTTPPTASFDANTTTIEEESAISFDGSGSDDNHEIADYKWDFGDGTTDTGTVVTHTFEVAGTYDVTLTVTDSSGNINTVTQEITVENATSDGDGSDDSTGDDGSDGSDDGSSGGGSSGGGQGGAGGGGAGGGGGSSVSDEANDGSNDTQTVASGPVNLDIIPTANGYRASVQNATALEPIHVTLDGATNKEIVLQNMEISLSQPVHSFTIDVVSPSTEPAGVHQLEETPAIGYYRADRIDISNEDIDEIRFRFKVAETALPDGANADDLVVYRYHAGEWRQLQTTFEGNDTYVAVAPGLSAFAVALHPDSQVASQPDLETRNVSLLSDSVELGEEVIVEGIVANTGYATGEATVSLSIDDETITEKTMKVPPGEYREVQFSVAVEQAGTYNVRLNGLSAGSLTVLDAEDTSGDQTAGDSQSDEADGTTSGTAAKSTQSGDRQLENQLLSLLPGDRIPPIGGIAIGIGLVMSALLLTWKREYIGTKVWTWSMTLRDHVTGTEDTSHGSSTSGSEFSDSRPNDEELHTSTFEWVDKGEEIADD